jgi:hypothetical protein
MAMFIDMSAISRQMTRVVGIVSRNGGNFLGIWRHRSITMLSAKDQCVDLILETRERKRLYRTLVELSDADYTLLIRNRNAPE